MVHKIILLLSLVIYATWCKALVQVLVYCYTDLAARSSINYYPDQRTAGVRTGDQPYWWEVKELARPQ